MTGSTLTTNDADTYGWDTVFALNFTHANSAIVANWPNVNAGAKNVSQVASDDSSFNINGVLGPWQLTMGGDGKNVRMLCPFVSGTYKAPSNSYDLGAKNVQVVIEIGMEWVPDPGQFNFVLSGNTTIDPIKADLNNNKIDAALQAAFTKQSKTLSGSATATMLIKDKEWVIADGSVNYYLFVTTDKDNNEFMSIYQFITAWAANLKALKNAVSTDDPAVAVIQIVNDPTSGIAAAVLPDLLSTWFNTNIGEFNHVFSILDLSPVVAKQTNYTWMLPTATSYAVTDQGTMDSSIFGVLTMVQNNTPGQNHQVSPYAIPSGTDAGFLISGPNFMQYMMLGGAQTIFNNAPASSFVVSNDGLTITNKDKILFGKFHMDDSPKATIADNGYSGQLDNKQLPQGLINDLQNANIDVSSDGVTVTDKGSQWLLSTGNANDDEYIVNKKDGNLEFYLATSIYVDAGKFQMSLNHTWVQIQFIDVTYPANSDWDTHVNFTENVPLSLKNESGKNIFWMGQSFARSMVVSVTQTQSAITREIVEAAIAGAVALLAIAGPIIEGLAAGAEIGAVSDEAGEAVIDEEAFASAEEDNPQAAEEDEEESGESAANQSKGRWGNIKAAFKTPKWKFVGWLAALAGGVAAGDKIVDEILKQAALKQWQNVPGFDDFAETAIQPYTWPNISGFTLKTSGLAGSLQIGMTVNPPKQS
jgi:hypothetical protein